MKLPCEIWIVFGSTGEYSDYSEWTVAAYVSKELAEAHCAKCRRWYEDHGGQELRELIWQSNAEKNPYDEQMRVAYPVTTWGVFSVTLRDTLPTQ